MSEIRTYLSDLAKHEGRIEKAYQIHRQSDHSADRISFVAGYEASCSHFWNKRTPVPETNSAGWRPISEADKSIATVQSFAGVSVTLRNSYPVWVRDEDGRAYEAVWTEGLSNFWWDLEGEVSVDPAEFMPHPLDPKFVATEPVVNTRLPYDLRLQIGRALDRIVCDDSTPEQVDKFIETFREFGLTVSHAPAQMELGAALRLAIEHIEHMAAFIGTLKAGYSFESLGEDMPGLKATFATLLQGANTGVIDEYQVADPATGQWRRANSLDVMAFVERGWPVRVFLENSTLWNLVEDEMSIGRMPEPSPVPNGGVNRAGSNGETLEKSCLNDPENDPKNENILSPAPKMPVRKSEAYTNAENDFAVYFARNYPGPDTLIFDPKWHAPKIFYAAFRALAHAAANRGEQP